jgi:hypothetical protein
MSILILGHGRHGKDTAAEFLRDNHGLSFSSSSWIAANEFIFDDLKGMFDYSSVKKCFDDRHNHRALWNQMIAEYNKDDPTRLAKLILSDYDIYVGMRSQREYTACVEQQLFDLVIWVDASTRVGKFEDSSSFDIDYKSNMIWVDNNRRLIDLEYDIEWVNKIHNQILASKNEKN